MNKSGRLKRVLFLAYGFVSYLMFLGVLLYAIGFIVNFGVPTSLDAPREGTLVGAIIVNLALLTLFALQHSVMARPTFKNWWTQFVPKPIERSTYVLFTNLAMILIFTFWRPMGGIVWDIESTTLCGIVYGIYALGWAIVLYATCLINHFDLFGLRQVWMHFRCQPYTQLAFREPGLYRYIRHPLYVGWLTVFWATPTMTFAHLLFAVVTTCYIMIAIRFEESNLADHLPGYDEYRRRVPMLLPTMKKSSSVVIQDGE